MDKVPDVLHVEQAAVGQVLLLVAVDGQVQQNFAVLFNADDVGVEDRDAHLRGVRPFQTVTMMSKVTPFSTCSTFTSACSR